MEGGSNDLEIYCASRAGLESDAYIYGSFSRENVY